MFLVLLRKLWGLGSNSANVLGKTHFCAAALGEKMEFCSKSEELERTVQNSFERTRQSTNPRPRNGRFPQENRILWIISHIKIILIIPSWVQRVFQRWGCTELSYLWLYIILNYITLFDIMLYYVALCFVVSHCGLLSNVILYITRLYYVAQYNILLSYICAMCPIMIYSAIVYYRISDSITWKSLRVGVGWPVTTFMYTYVVTSLIMLSF